MPRRSRPAKTRGFERPSHTRVAAIAGFFLLVGGAGAFLLASHTGSGPGDSVGPRGAVEGVRQHPGALDAHIQGGSGQRSRGAGQSASPPGHPGTQGSARARSQGAGQSAPVASETAPPAPEPAPSRSRWPRRSRLPSRAGSRSGAAQLDLEPGKERRRGRGLPTRVRLRVLAVREDMSASGPPKATSARVRASRSPCSAAAIAFAPLARAGPYKAVQCAAHLGAGHGGFHFSRSSPDFHRVRACGSGDGLGVTHERSRTGAGGYGVWVAKPPAGTYFTRGRLLARGRRDGAYRPRLLLDPPRRSAPDAIGSPRRRFRAFEWRARSRGTA